MTLDKIKRGQSIKILQIANADIRDQAIRFGISEGEVVICQEIIPAGPVIIRRNKQELALGRGLAKDIKVELI